MTAPKAHSSYLADTDTFRAISRACGDIQRAILLTPIETLVATITLVVHKKDINVQKASAGRSKKLWTLKRIHLFTIICCLARSAP